jgi:phage terminase large subunit
LIIEELEWVKQYEMDKDGKKRVLPKEKIKEAIGRSPDFADMLMMREWFEIGFQFVPVGGEL